MIWLEITQDGPDAREGGRKQIQAGRQSIYKHPFHRHCANYKINRPKSALPNCSPPSLGHGGRQDFPRVAQEVPTFPGNGPSSQPAVGQVRSDRLELL